MKINKTLILVLFMLLLIYLYNKPNREDFVPFEALVDYKKIQQLHNITRKVTSIFEKNKLEYWATGGTLLGAVRDKTIIPWDDDVDVCIMDTQLTLFLSLKDELAKEKYEIVDWFGGYKVQMINGDSIKEKYTFPFVDIFVMMKENNKVTFKNKKLLDIWKNEFFYVKDLYPLKKYKFEDYMVYGPNNPLEYINRSFPGWKKTAYKNYDHATDKFIKEINFDIDYDMDEKPYLWQYWDNKDGKKTPAWIELCMETVINKCSKSFNVVRLNKDNITDYLPELKDLKLQDKLDKLIIAHRVDLYRIMLLYKYGGLYMDADIIVLQDPIEIMDKLDKYELVGFGCTGVNCKYGYGQPSNWILASRPTSIIMSRILKKLLNKINTQDKFEYHDLGKLVIWDEIANLLKTDEYTYYHYPNKIDGSRDKYGNWITSEIAFSNYRIEYDNEDKMLFFVIYNSDTPERVTKMSREELLKKDWNFTRFLKK